MIERQRATDESDGVVHFRPRRKLAPRQSVAFTLNLAPMVDVVFLLLIFFISTTTFKRAEGVLASRLPKEGGFASETALPVTPIVVHLAPGASGPTEYGLRVEGFVNTPVTFGELTSFLLELQRNPGFDDQTPIIIQAPAELLWDHVVGCWNAAVRADCKHIAFGRGS